MQNGKIKVLVVDDVETSRELLAEALDDVGYQVGVVASGEAAIECVKRAEGDFDFILMDQVLLGGMDGIEAARIINQDYPQIRTIVMTIYGDGESSRAALDAGADRYVFRSLDLEEAVDDIIALIESARELSKIEKTLPESFWMKNVFKGMGMAISIIDRTYRVLYANDIQNQMAGGELRIGGICWVEFHQAFQQKGPCPWCPVRPLFEGENPVVKIVPLFKRGLLQYWQTGASPILLDIGRQVIAALKWDVDVTEREQAHVAALTAQTVDERLEAALDQIRMLGYSRARLYELSDDGTTLMGRKQVGGMNVPITEIRFHVEEDPYSEITLSSRVPVIHQIGEHGNTLFDSEINRDRLEEWLDVPLWTGDAHRVGKISIDNKITEPVRPDRPFSPRPITDEHFESLLTIAGFAANAIWSEREYQRVVQESELLRKLRAFDADLAQTLETQQVLRKVVQACLELTGAESGNIRLQRGDKLVQEVSIGEFSRILDQELSMSQDHIPCVWVAKTGKRYVANRAQEDGHIIDEWKNRIDQSKLRILEVLGSYVSYPLEVGGETIGVLSLLSKKPDFFTDQICSIIEDFRSRAAVAIENARLFEQLEESFGQIAHQLRSPLTDMRGFTQLLADGRETRPEKMQEYYTFILAAMEDFDSMVTDMLNLKKIEAGAFKFRMREASLRNIIRKAVGHDRYTVMVRRIEIKEDFRHGQDLITVDEERLASAVQVLIENAIHYSDKGGKVIISTKEDGENVYISVRDEGWGIPEEELPRIFEKYFRGEIAHRIEGTGIGLTIAKYIVERHGGGILVNTVFGKGSTFTIRLPRGQEVDNGGRD